MKKVGWKVRTEAATRKFRNFGTSATVNIIGQTSQDLSGTFRKGIPNPACICLAYRGMESEFRSLQRWFSILSLHKATVKMIYPETHVRENYWKCPSEALGTIFRNHNTIQSSVQQSSIVSICTKAMILMTHTHGHQRAGGRSGQEATASRTTVVDYDCGMLPPSKKK